MNLLQNLNPSNTVYYARMYFVIVSYNTNTNRISNVVGRVKYYVKCKHTHIHTGVLQEICYCIFLVWCRGSPQTYAHTQMHALAYRVCIFVIEHLPVEIASPSSRLSLAADESDAPHHFALVCFLWQFPPTPHRWGAWRHLK